MQGDNATGIIIADDFTGACDTGVQFARAGSPCPVLLADSKHAFQEFDLSTILSEHSHVVCDTESRHAGPSHAAERVELVARAAAQKPLQLVYKKVDSTLRGNVEAELMAVASVFSGRILVVAPAFPATGRTTEEGRCLVDGTPVDRTEFAEDRFSPVRSARVADFLSFAAGVIHCRPDALGANLVRARAGTAIVVDVRTEADLRAVATSVVTRLDRLIVVGSGGLASTLSPLLAGSQPSVRVTEDGYSERLSDDPKTETRRPVLGIVGSLSEVSHRQTNVLVGRTRVASLILDPRRIDQLKSRIVTYLAKGRDVVLVTASPTTRVDVANSARVAAHVADVVRSALGSVHNLGLFLTGGDTARSAIRALSGTAVMVRREIMPGVVLSTLLASAGRHTGVVPVVTKAGGFGADDAMVRAYACLGAIL